MGHKVHPLALRLGFIRNWQSRWFAGSKDYAKFIQQDYKIRKIIRAKFKHAAISGIVIERLAQRIRVRIATARPGIIIGRHGSDIEKLREEINSLVKTEVSIDVDEIKVPAMDAQLVAQNVALQIEKRVAFRRAIKRALEQTMNAGAKGIKITCSGRLGGAEMSRTETYKQGKIPLSTLRADIEYGFTESLTTYGLIGIKVWLYKGDILGKVGVVSSPVSRETKSEAQANPPESAAQPAKE
ncbi:MAG: 30S ribosomal protein S3 [Candidatus Omnitrophota bacterium]